MAKALVGHLERGSRSTAMLDVENARLRARVQDLEVLVGRLAEENDQLSARLSARLADEALQPA